MGDRSSIENQHGGAASCSLCLSPNDVSPLIKCAGNGGVRGGSCGVHAHENCLVKFHKKTSSRTDAYDYWRCQPCIDGKDSAQLECHLCTGPRGVALFSKDDTNNYVHALCKFHGVYALPAPEYSICHSCDKQMFKNTCCMENHCKHRIHPMCAFRNGHGDITGLKCSTYCRGGGRLQPARPANAPLEPAVNIDTFESVRRPKNFVVIPDEEEVTSPAVSASSDRALSPSSPPPSAPSTAAPSGSRLITPSSVQHLMKQSSTFVAYPAVPPQNSCPPPPAPLPSGPAVPPSDTCPVTPSPAPIQGESSPNSSAKRRRQSVVETDENGDKTSDNAKRARVDDVAVASSSAVIVADTAASEEAHPDFANDPATPREPTKAKRTRKSGQMKRSPPGSKKTVAQWREEVAQLKEGHTQLSTKVAQLQESCDSKDTELAKLKASCDRLSAHVTEANKARDRALAEIRSRDKKILELRAELDRSAAAQASAKNEYERELNKVDRAKNAAAAAQIQRVTDLSAELNERERRYNDLQLQMKQLTSLHEELAKQNAVLKSQNEEAAKQTATLVRQHEDVTKQKELLAQQNAALAQQKDALVRDNAVVTRDKEALAQENASRKVEVDNLNANNTMLQEELATAKKSVDLHLSNYKNMGNSLLAYYERATQPSPSNDTGVPALSALAVNAAANTNQAPALARAPQAATVLPQPRAQATTGLPQPTTGVQLPRAQAATGLPQASSSMPMMVPPPGSRPFAAPSFGPQRVIMNNMNGTGSRPVPYQGVRPVPQMHPTRHVTNAGPVGAVPPTNARPVGAGPARNGSAAEDEGIPPPPYQEMP